MSIERINDRLDAVQDLTNEPQYLTKFMGRMAKLPDLEKLLGQIYQYSVNQNAKAIYFENVNLNKLKALHNILGTLRNIPDLIGTFSSDFKSSVTSERLKNLISSAHETENGLIPNLEEELAPFKEMVIWKKVGDEKIPEPASGIDEVFDRCNDEVNKIKAEFEEYIVTIREQFGQDSIKFTHVK